VGNCTWGGPPDYTANFSWDCYSKVRVQIDEYVVRALKVSDSFLVSAYVLGLWMNKLAEWFVLGVHAGRWHFAICRWCALFWTGLQCSSDNRLRYE
jgi:hypothetical protein